MRRWFSIVILSLGVLSARPAAAADPAWIEIFGAIAVQDGGRIMPLDTYAMNLAVALTGRTRWAKSRGPAAFAGRHRIELLCDLLFQADVVANQTLIAIDNRPMKQEAGLETTRRFFSPRELMASRGLRQVVETFRVAKREDPKARPNAIQSPALDALGSLERFFQLQNQPALAVVPHPPGESFTRLGAGVSTSEAPAQAAWLAFGAAYREGGDLAAAASALAAAINQMYALSPADAHRIDLELFYNRHQPWRNTAVSYGLAIVLLGLSALFWRRWLILAGLICVGVGVAENTFGIYLRATILQRAPVSNTYESLLWMGLVAVIVAGVAQWRYRKSYYLVGGLVAAELSVLFAMLVPLQSQTNALPAVLRSNFWLIIHVMTIVASYGVLALGAVLGHIYLVRAWVQKRRAKPVPEETHSLLTQIFRMMQIGLVLLTVGTITGGIWAADSWGRFWGWDPKETWSLISILVYFTLLHARRVSWLGDFGLAVSPIAGFMAIVWTFYGVNYVMASGLHSYAFGSGGELWVGLWALAEILFLGLVWTRLRKTPRLSTLPESS